MAALYLPSSLSLVLLQALEKFCVFVFQHSFRTRSAGGFHSNHERIRGVIVRQPTQKDAVRFSVARVWRLRAASPCGPFSQVRSGGGMVMRTFRPSSKYGGCQADGLSAGPGDFWKSHAGAMLTKNRMGTHPPAQGQRQASSAHPLRAARRTRPPLPQTEGSSPQRKAPLLRFGPGAASHDYDYLLRRGLGLGVHWRPWPVLEGSGRPVLRRGRGNP